MDHPWRVKVRQAAEHLARFEMDCDAYLRDANVGLRHEVDAESGTVRVRLHADAEPPLSLGATIGDVLHNLQSALDSVAWAACQKDGAAALKEGQERRIYFPADSDPDKWDDTARDKLPGIAGTDLEVFRRLQPWWWDQMSRDVGVDVPLSYAEHRPLYRLHDLSRVDRHRVPHPVLARAGHTWLGHDEGVTVLDATVHRARDARPGEVFLEWRVDPPSSAADVHPDGEVVLALEEADGWVPRRAVDDLRAMQRAVVEATRRVEVEVLGLVSGEDFDSLAALDRAATEAEAGLFALVGGDHVIDQPYMDAFSAAEREAARTKAEYQARWRDLFGDQSSGSRCPNRCLARTGASLRREPSPSRSDARAGCDLLVQTLSHVVRPRLLG